MRYLLDTNIFIHYLRADDLSRRVDLQFQPLSAENEPLISVVSVGELESLALQLNWGNQKKQTLNSLLNRLLITDIYVRQIINAYAEIDAFSQNKLVQRPLSLSARNMGKNDLWIAATASVLNATLLTTDADFDHLSGVFLKVERI